MPTKRDSSTASFRRSRSKSAQIRRGELKISNPVLVSEYHGTAEELAASVENGSLNMEPQKENDGIDRLDMGRISSARPSYEVAQNPPARHPTVLRKASTIRRSNIPPQTPNSFHSTSDGQTVNTKRRKSGGLRSVLRKVFGKKDRKSNATTPTSNRNSVVQSSPPRHNYHKSDPGAALNPQENPNANGGPVMPPQPRIVSLPTPPAEPITPKTGLNSHLPFPMNVNAPIPDSPERGYIRLRPQVTPRRATLPSLVFSHGEAAQVAAIHDAWRQSEDRTHPEETQSLHGSILSREIGVAITKEDARVHRRSRSAAELHKLLKEQEAAEPRRRSDEIKYWRTSHTLPRGSLMTSATEDDNDEITRVYEEDGSEPAIVPYHDPYTEDEEPPPALSYAQDDGPMNIPYIQDIRDDESQVDAGDRHAETPDLLRLIKESRGSDSGVGASADGDEKRMSSRVSNVELRMRALEESFQKLNGRNNRQTIVLEAPRGRRPSKRSPLPDSMRISPTHVPDQLPSPDISADEASLFAPDTFLSSPSTVGYPKESKSQLTLGDTTDLPPANIYPHLTPLYNALQYERSCRKHLEGEMIRLQREIFDLQVLVKRLSDKNTGYPTPSPDTSFIPNIKESRFSGPDTETEDENESDETEKEVYQTPREDVPPPRFPTFIPLNDYKEGEMF